MNELFRVMCSRIDVAHLLPVNNNNAFFEGAFLGTQGHYKMCYVTFNKTTLKCGNERKKEKLHILIEINSRMGKGKKTLLLSRVSFESLLLS